MFPLSESVRQRRRTKVIGLGQPRCSRIVKLHASQQSQFTLLTRKHRSLRSSHSLVARSPHPEQLDLRLCPVDFQMNDVAGLGCVGADAVAHDRARELGAPGRLYYILDRRESCTGEIFGHFELGLNSRNCPCRVGDRRLERIVAIPPDCYSERKSSPVGRNNLVVPTRSSICT